MIKDYKCYALNEQQQTKASPVREFFFTLCGALAAFVAMMLSLIILFSFGA